MEEIVFFNEDRVIVTNARFIARGQTYAIRNITSVKFSQKTPNRTPAVVIGMIGVSLCEIKNEWIPIGVVILFVAILIAILQKTEYSVILTTSSGEATALTSEKRTYVENVVHALNDSIIHRG